MLKKIVFIGFLAVLSTTVFSQGKITLKEEKLSDFQPQSLFRTNNQVGYLFKVENGEYEAVGYKGERLEILLKTDEAAYKEFKKFKRKINIGKVTYWIGVGGLIVLPITITENDTNEQAAGKLLSGALIGLSGGLTTILLNKNAPKHLYNAVEIYNQNLK